MAGNQSGFGPPNPTAIMALRCKSCSAPLSAGQSDDIVRCDFCGASQKLVDARAFFDQVLLQVNAWVRQAIPFGIDAIATGVIDPVARHTIFMTNIRPRLSTEYGEYRFNCFNLLSHPLAVLPYMVEKGVPFSNAPRDVFLFQAKVQQVSPLAVDEECKGLVSEIDALSVVYGYLLNNTALMTDLRPERYHFMTQNFDAAAGALKSVGKFSILRDRLNGLGKLSKGLDEVTSLKVEESLITFDESRNLLLTAKAAATQNMDMALMSQAIDKEISLLNSSYSFAEALKCTPGGDYAATIQPLRNLMNILGTYREQSPPQWQSRFSDVGHHEQILKVVADIQKAKSGIGTINIYPIGGTVLFPFWAIDIPYTFQTGSLWKTQGVEVTEALLVAATFPTDLDAFYRNEPRLILTDVFHARERSGFFNETFKRLSGRETSISGGGPIREIMNRAQPLTTGGLKVVPPLSSSNDAVVIVQEYVTKVRQTDRTVNNQLRLSAPRAIGLIFIPGTPDGYSPNVTPWLGSLAPRSVGSLGTLASIAL